MKAFFCCRVAECVNCCTQKIQNPDCAGALKVLVYEVDVNHISASSGADNVLSPHDLASADIVLTTYDTLQRDFHRVDGNSNLYNFRRPKRYEVRNNISAGEIATDRLAQAIYL